MQQRLMSAFLINERSIKSRVAKKNIARTHTHTSSGEILKITFVIMFSNTLKHYHNLRNMHSMPCFKLRNPLIWHKTAIAFGKCVGQKQKRNSLCDAPCAEDMAECVYVWHIITQRIFHVLCCVQVFFLKKCSQRDLRIWLLKWWF